MFPNEKLNLLIKVFCLVISSLEMQRRLIQTKLYYKLFYSIANFSQTFKVAAAKNVFPSAYVTGATALSDCFYSICYLEDIILYTNLSLPRGLLQAPRSLKQVFRKKSVFYVRYLHNDSIMLLIPKIQIKSSTS